MKAVAIKGMWSVLLFAACGQGAAPQPEPGLALDPSRPYLEIVYDHLGPRTPVFAGESRRGLWLSFRNNSRYLVKLLALSAADANAGALLQYDILTIPPARDTVSSPATDLVPAPRARFGGYSELSHTPKYVDLPSGRAVLFSVPAEHVSPDTYLRIEALLQLPPLIRRVPPETALTFPQVFVNFFWSGLPDNIASTLESAR